MLLNRLLVIIIIFVFPFEAEAQFVVLGQEPAKLHWFQVRTPHFQLIFPEDFVNNANYLANQMEYAWVHDTKTLGFQPKLTRVILHTGSVESNAISLIAPSRSEYYMTPPQNNFAHGWQEQLIAHEFRHMVQEAKLRQGFTKLLSYPFGDYARALTFGFFTPMWYMEGDAVVMETALSHSGRGRLPGFEMVVKAQLLEKVMFHFQKASLGSFRDLVPDQYYFGYYYIALCREKYGPDLWDKGMNQAAGKPYLIAPLNLSFKKQVGFTKRTLYDTLFSELTHRFRQVQKEIPLTPYSKIIIPPKKIYTNYRFPRYLNDSMIIAEKNGMADIASFISINIHSGKEKVLCSPGFYASEGLPKILPIIIIGKNSPSSITADNLSLDRQKICWAEKKYDPRWQFKNYSVIMVYDLAKKTKKQVTHQSNFFAPVFFPGKDSILAVEVKSDSCCNLVIINPVDGKIVHRLPNPLKDFYMIPAISKGGKTIAVVTFNRGGKSLKLINIQDGSTRTLVKPTFDEISAPLWYKNYIIYNAALSGVDNIYAIDTNTLKRFQVTSAAYGAYQPDFSADGKKMVYSQYTARGYEIVETELDASRWHNIETITYKGIALYKSFLSQEDGIMDRAHAPNVKYEIKPYHKATHLFNPHSWAPATLSVGDRTLRPGISFVSQNILSTSILNAGYSYMPHEKTGYYFIGYTYSGFYPVFDLTVANSERDVLTIGNGIDQHSRWLENSASFGIRLPLISTVGNFFQNWEASVAWNYYQLSDYEVSPFSLPDHFNMIKLGLNVGNLQKITVRDMAPRWGQLFRINYYKSTDLQQIEEMVGSGDLFFPGFLKHHSIKLSLDALTGNKDSYPFKETVRFPRGYLTYYHDKYWHLGADYKFPFLYPDVHLGSILYFKRVNLDFFYDYAEGNNASLLKTYRSCGYELSSDLNFLGFFIPINVGMRQSWLPVEKQNRFDLLVNINFEGL